MRRYFARLCWYLLLILIVIGSYLLHFPIVTIAVLSALGSYLPTSLFWIPLTYLFVKYVGFPEKTLGMNTARFGVAVILIGVLMVVSYYFFPSDNLASFSALVIFGGIECILMVRESKSILAS